MGKFKNHTVLTQLILDLPTFVVNYVSFVAIARFLGVSFCSNLVCGGRKIFYRTGPPRSPWCKKWAGFFRSNFEKWETLRPSFHSLRPSFFLLLSTKLRPWVHSCPLFHTQGLLFWPCRGPESTLPSHADFKNIRGSEKTRSPWCTRFTRIIIFLK